MTCGLRRSQADFLEPAAGSDDLSASLEAFGARPTLKTAEAVWHASYDAADFERLLAHAPCGRHDDPLSRRASDPLHDRWHAAFDVSSLGVPADNGPAVWYFITWHAEVERLFRLFGSLSRAANTYVISVGGSEPIERFPQVSALMLAGNVHLHYRPSVSWGGQKLLFQNVYDILECFSARTNDDAVFQIICNKTYPLAARSSSPRRWASPVIGNLREASLLGAAARLAHGVAGRRGGGASDCLQSSPRRCLPERESRSFFGPRKNSDDL